MKAYTVVENTIQPGILIFWYPPRIVLGGDNTTATCVNLRKEDASMIVSEHLACPMKDTWEFLYALKIPLDKKRDRICPYCGKRYTEWKQKTGRWCGLKFYVRTHPKTGKKNGPARIFDVEVTQVTSSDGRFTDPPQYLIGAPHNREDNRILVLWRVPSGYRGRAFISADKDVTVIAKATSWHPKYASTGETAEILAILGPGQQLCSRRSGHGVENTPHGQLSWDGKTITVTFGRAGDGCRRRLRRLAASICEPF